jgi:hypothetical protein
MCTGGRRMITLCALMPRCAWPWFRHEREMAGRRSRGIDSGRKLWQLGEPVADGQQGRCSVAHFQLSLLESWRSRESSHNRVLRGLRKAASKAEVGLLEDETALPVQRQDEKPAKKACAEPGQIIHRIQKLYRSFWGWVAQGESVSPFQEELHCEKRLCMVDRDAFRREMIHRGAKEGFQPVMQSSLG